MAEYVDFHYMPLEGKITGKQVLKQTEDAINDLGQHVYEIDIDDEKIQEAIDTSNQAIETAEAAMSAVTTNRAMWFNSVAELREANIEAGVTAATRGFAFSGDGGHAIYEIRQQKAGDVDNGETIVFLDNGNVAECIDINVPRNVDSVAELKSQALLKGYEVSTKGYYAPNNGDSAMYYIREKVYGESTDESVAYTKTVPADMEKMQLHELGGKTLVWNQLVDSGTTEVQTISGRKYYTLIDGTASIVTSDGTAISVVDDTADMVCDLTLMFGAGNEPATTNAFVDIFPASHYPYNEGTLLSAEVTKVDSKGKNLINQDDFFSMVSGAIKSTDYWVVGTSSLSSKFSYTDYEGNASPVFTQNSLTMSFDIKLDSSESSGSTLYYGFFRENDSSGSLSNVTFTTEWQHVSKTIENNEACKIAFSYASGKKVDIRNFQIESGTTATAYAPYIEASLPIPAEIQAIEGYGWSAGNVYNYVDFERKVFVKRVGRVILNGTQTVGSENWRPNANGVGWLYFNGTTPNLKKATGNALPNIVSDKLRPSVYTNLYSGVLGVGASTTVPAYGLIVMQSNTSLTTKSAINAYMAEHPITVYYELETPVETDVSAYLTNDLLDVGANGTITFSNSNGDDYRVPVPSNETFFYGDIEDGDSIIFLNNGNLAERIQSMNITARGNDITYVSNVAELIDSDAIIGNVYGTVGYRYRNDGGSALYNIRSKSQSDVDNGWSTIFLNNGNVAERISSAPQRITVEELATVSSGVYTLGKVTVDSPIMLKQRSNRAIMIVDSDITINTPVMIPNSMGNSYFIVPNFANCIFRNGTDGRVALFGDSYFVGSGFSHCAFFDVDCCSNCNYVQTFVFVDCYIASNSIFLESTRNVQAKFIGCNSESDCKRLIKASYASVFMSGTYEGNVSQGTPYIEVDHTIGLNLNSAYFEGAYILHVTGTTAATDKSSIILTGCSLNGSSDPDFCLMTFDHPEMVRIYIHGCGFNAYNSSSKFTNHSADEFLRVEGTFLSSTAETYNYPFNGVSALNHKLAMIKDVNAVERVSNYRHSMQNGDSVTKTLPLGQYILFAGTATYNCLTSTEIYMVGASTDSSQTSTSVIRIRPAENPTLTITATKTNASDTTFSVTIQNDGSARFVNIYIMRLS